MQHDTFKNRLLGGKALGYQYEFEDKHGLIEVWRSEDILVLTWEEWPGDNQFNEHLYTRDEVHHFARVEEIIIFLNKNGISAELFTP